MKSTLGLLFGIFLSLGLATFAGENPWHVFVVLFKSSFGSLEDLSLTLFYTTSLIFTGLAICIPFHAGLFNIGAEGQLNIACLASTMVALLFPSLAGFWVVVPLLIGFLAGCLWAAIPGALKAYRGSHEVILTMMMNFIAAGLSSYFIVGILQNPDSQAPETKLLGPGQFLRNFDPVAKMFPDSPINFSFIVALLFCLFVWIFLFKTRFGFSLRATGENKWMSERSGVNVKKQITFALALGGLMASGVLLNDVFGSAGKLKLGFSPEYGFVGIAVSLLARNNPLWIIVSAFFFAVLQKGALDLDLETEYITRDYAHVIQAIVILSVVVFAKLNWSSISSKWTKFFQSRKSHEQS